MKNVLRMTRGNLSEEAIDKLLHLPARTTDPTNSQHALLGAKKAAKLADWYVLTFSGAVEGVVCHPYIDSEGYVTIGKGHKILSAHSEQAIFEALQQLNQTYPLTSCPNSASLPDGAVHCKLALAHLEKAQEKDLKRAAAFLASKYRRLKRANAFKKSAAKQDYDEQRNYLLLKQEDVIRLATSDTNEILNQLEKAYPKFTTFPVGAQAALLDMGYNLGVEKLRSVFVNLNKLINTSSSANWVKIATQKEPNGRYYFSRKDEQIGPERNAATHALFLLAAAFVTNQTQPHGDTQ